MLLKIVFIVICEVIASKLKVASGTENKSGALSIN